MHVHQICDFGRFGTKTQDHANFLSRCVPLRIPDRRRAKIPPPVSVGTDFHRPERLKPTGGAGGVLSGGRTAESLIRQGGVFKQMVESRTVVVCLGRRGSIPLAASPPLRGARLLPTKRPEAEKLHRQILRPLRTPNLLNVHEQANTAPKPREIALTLHDVATKNDTTYHISQSTNRPPGLSRKTRFTRAMQVAVGFSHGPELSLLRLGANPALG